MLANVAIDFGSFILISYEDGVHAKSPLSLVKFYPPRTRRGDIIKKYPCLCRDLAMPMDGIST